VTTWVESGRRDDARVVAYSDYELGTIHGAIIEE
jgi:hypothetical protein